MNENLHTINYTITFYSPWHCGSGLSAGADVDALVVKDENGMPFVPGKTLKGLIREALENYISMSYDTQEDIIKTAEETFGRKCNNTNENESAMGSAHFSNAVLCSQEYDTIVRNNLQKYLYSKLTTTAIDENGIAKDHSLRSEEVVVPCTLYASITGVPENIYEILTNSFGLIKRLGQKRNRGLGRCDIKEGGAL